MKGPGSHAIGRRKTARARAYLREGSGNITINGRALEEYFGRPTLQAIARDALEQTGELETHDLVINVKGGGKSGQAGAIRHAVARALELEKPELRPELKSRRMLTRDPREVERKKFGRHKARKKPQFSKR